MKTIYLVRHGEAIDDVEDLYGGAADHAPTKKSLKEAAEFGETFKDKSVGVVIASPYQRARKPAEIIAENLRVPLETEDGLREKNRYGRLTGMKKSEAKSKFPEIVAELERNEDIEGAEPEKDFCKRVRDALDKIWQREENTILVLTHMGVIRAGLGFRFGEIKVDHYGWVKIAKKDDKWEILESRGLKFL